jgi:hypothetical protein
MPPCSAARPRDLAISGRLAILTMKSRLANPILGPPRWRGLLGFWVLILTFGIATASLLQALGPTSRHSETTINSRLPAELASGRQINPHASPTSPPGVGSPVSPSSQPRLGNPASPNSLRGVGNSALPGPPLNLHNPAPLSSPSDRLINNLVRTTKEPTSGGHPVLDSLAQLSALLSRAPPADLVQGMDVQLQLDKLARAAAAAGKFDTAYKALAIAHKLALHLPTPTVPSAGTSAVLPNSEGVARSSGAASQRNPDAGLFRTPLPSGRDTEVAASRVSAAPSVLPAGPIKSTQPPAGTSAVLSNSEGVARSSGTASQQNADTSLFHIPLPSGRDSEIAASRVSAAPPVSPAGPIKSGEASADPILIIHFFKSSALATTAADQLAAIAGSHFSQIKLIGGYRILPNAIIQYHSLRDHPITWDTGRELGRMGYGWQIEYVATQRRESAPEIIDVWIPPKAVPDHSSPGSLQEQAAPALASAASLPGPKLSKNADTALLHTRR